MLSPTARTGRPFGVVSPKFSPGHAMPTRATLTPMRLLRTPPCIYLGPGLEIARQPPAPW